MPHISSQIEISRPPADVRAVFLDFASWPAWLKNGLLVTYPAGNKSTAELKPGDKLRSEFNGTVVKPRVRANDSQTFQWHGNFHGLVIGDRRFFFKASDKTPGGTTLVQNEDVSGLLAFMFKPKSKQGKAAREAMDKFNADIKARVESI